LLKFAIRSLLIALVFAVLYQGLSRVFALAADGGSSNPARWLLHEVRRCEALQQRHMEMAQSEDVKKTISEEFIAGRLTLGEAVERFRAAAAMIEADQDGLIAPYRVPETRQGLHQQVRVWVENALSENHTPKEAESVRRRLEKEWEGQFRPEENIVN
jgi:hypothetical protein